MYSEAASLAPWDPVLCTDHTWADLAHNFSCVPWLSTFIRSKSKKLPYSSSTRSSSTLFSNQRHYFNFFTEAISFFVVPYVQKPGWKAWISNNSGNAFLSFTIKWMKQSLHNKHALCGTAVRRWMACLSPAVAHGHAVKPPQSVWPYFWWSWSGTWRWCVGPRWESPSSSSTSEASSCPEEASPLGGDRHISVLDTHTHGTEGLGLTLTSLVGRAEVQRGGAEGEQAGDQGRPLFHAHRVLHSENMS